MSLLRVNTFPLKNSRSTRVNLETDGETSNFSNQAKNSRFSISILNMNLENKIFRGGKLNQFKRGAYNKI